MKRIRVALAGNPNVGKTSILNHLAGTTLKVGNWPGVTVEKREGKALYGEYEIEIVDLPGVYTLAPLSEDEWVAFNYLTQEKPDVIVNVLETANMERDLFLTLELMELEKPMVIILNMIDEARRLGIEVDDERLEELTGVPVIKTNGRTGEGVRDVLRKVVEVYEGKILPKTPKYSAEVESALQKVVRYGKETRHELIQRILYSDDAKSIRESVKESLGRDLDDVLKDERFALAHGLYREILRRSSLTSKDITQALDKVLLHPYVGLVSFLLVMFLAFKIAFDFSSPFMDWIDGFMVSFLGPALEELLSYLGVSQVIKRFVSEALVSGVGFVLTFVPLLASLFVVLVFLEFSGYLPRVAFLMDRFMHRMGLHGKGVMPLLLGFGCNVPAVLATRTLETKRDKLLLISMIPFMSCPARLVVFSFFAYIFFKNPVLVIFSLYILGVLSAFFTAFLLRKTIFKGSLSHFIMELPPYRLPTLKLTFRIVWAHIRDFLYRAGTLIFAANVAIWLLLNLPPGVENPKDSVAGKVGQALTYVFEPIGIHDWRMTTSLIPAFLAREIAIGSMATIYAVEKEEEKREFILVEAVKEQSLGFLKAVKDAFLNVLNPMPKAFEVEEESIELKALIAKSVSPAAALSFMIMLLIYNSCLGTFGVMWKEAGRRFALIFLVYSFLLGWVIAFLVYHMGKPWIT